MTKTFWDRAAKIYDRFMQENEGLKASFPLTYVECMKGENYESEL